MNLTRISLSNPVAVMAAILLVILIGAIGLFSLPIQMIPDVQRPFSQINTGWRAAAPEEVESEIVEPQEDMLRGLPGRASSLMHGSGGGLGCFMMVASPGLWSTTLRPQNSVPKRPERRWPNWHDPGGPVEACTAELPG